MSKLGRRSMLGAMGAITTTVAARASVPSAATASAETPAETTPRATHAENPPPADATTAHLLGAIAAGDPVASFSFVRAHGTFFGAIPVVLADAEGQLLQFDVLANDSIPSPLAATENYAVFFVDGGEGNAPPHPRVAEAARALASRLRGGVSLLTFRQRAERFPTSVRRVLDNPTRG
ncbi:MAG: hypothetical protein AAGE52_39895 [Myxococcota bacterium]